MKEELIKKYCRQYPDYGSYEWYRESEGNLDRLSGIDALKEVAPQYEKALQALENIRLIISDIQRSDNLINDYLQIGEALSEIEITLKLYNGN